MTKGTIVTVALVGGLVAAFIWSLSESTRLIRCAVQLDVNGIRFANAQMTFRVDLEDKVVKGPDGKYPMTVTPDRLAWSFVAPSEDGGRTTSEVSISRPEGALQYASTTRYDASPPRSSRATGKCSGV